MNNTLDIAYAGEPFFRGKTSSADLGTLDVPYAGEPFVTPGDWSATGAITLGHFTAAATGTSAHQGTGGITLRHLTVAASAIASHKGSGGVTLGHLVAAALAISSHQGIGGISLPHISMAGAGTAFTPVRRQIQLKVVMANPAHVIVRANPDHAVHNTTAEPE